MKEENIFVKSPHSVKKDTLWHLFSVFVLFCLICPLSLQFFKIERNNFSARHSTLASLALDHSCCSPLNARLVCCSLLDIQYSFCSTLTPLDPHHLPFLTDLAHHRTHWVGTIPGCPFKEYKKWNKKLLVGSGLTLKLDRTHWVSLVLNHFFKEYKNEIINYRLVSSWPRNQTKPIGSVLSSVPSSIESVLGPKNWGPTLCELVLELRRGLA